MISSGTAHRLKPSLSICITSRILNVPGLGLTHHLYNVEGTPLELVQLLFLDI